MKRRIGGGYLRVQASRVVGDASLDAPSIRSRFPGESPLPLYGLAGSFRGERWDEGEGWDVRAIAHRPVGYEEELIVGVGRRTTVGHGGREPRTALPADAARCSVAMDLVLDNPNAGGDPFVAARGVANDRDAWGKQEITVDGELIIGYEREFGGRWLAYYLTPLLIVSVLAPVALRLDEVVLRTLRPDEVGPSRHGDAPTGSKAAKCRMEAKGTK